MTRLDARGAVSLVPACVAVFLVTIFALICKFSILLFFADWAEPLALFAAERRVVIRVAILGSATTNSFAGLLITFRDYNCCGSCASEACFFWAERVMIVLIVVLCFTRAFVLELSGYLFEFFN